MREFWLKLHRKTLDNPIVMKDGDHLAIWIWLLCEAAYAPHDRMFGKNRITLQPGQLITGREQIASELKINQSKVQRVLKLFESEQQIEQQTTRYGRLISILNWSEYQDGEQQIEQQVNNERTTSEQQVNATEERKKVRKKEDIYSDVPSEIKDVFMEWAEMRKKIKKPLTSKRAVTMALNALTKLTEDPAEQIKLIEYAIYKNWQSFYPIDKQGKTVSVYGKPEPPKYPQFEREPEIETVQIPEEIRRKLGEMFE